MKLICALFLCVVLTACSNPGYSTRININKANGLNEDLIQGSIKTFLSNTQHDVVMIQEEKNWKIESYDIQLKEKKFWHLKHKYIGVAVEYWFEKSISENQRLLKKVQVRIGNSWEGKEPNLKNEIDKITDYFVSQLTHNLDKSNFSIQRKYVSPI